MKRLIFSLGYYVIPIIAFSQVLLMSCSKEDNNIADATTSDFTVYKNQTKDVNADALQAQYKDSQTTLNFYGLFDQDKNPTTIKTLTYQRTNNDTIVNLINDPLTNRLASSYLTVRGVKSPVVMKFDYIDNSGLNVSFYKYDWGNNTSEIIYSAYLIYGVVNAGKNSFYYNGSSFSDISYKAGDVDYGINLGAFGVGLVFAEIVGTIGGGFTIIGALSAAGATVAASGTAVAIATGLAIGAAILIINDAAAEEIIPTNLPHPTNTPIDNPVSQENNPTPNLEPSGCNGNNITFEASMDAFGSIMFSGIQGGVGPYTFGVGSATQQTEVFPNKYIDGSYLVSVKDANGCVSIKVVPLKGVKGLSIVGDLSFGDVKIDTEVTKSVTLVNGGPLAINVSSISLPSDFTVDWKSGTVGVNGSVTVYISFKPTNVKDYSGTMTVNNDVDQFNNIIAISGKGVESNEFSLVGTWSMITFLNGIPAGEYTKISSEEGNCPSITTHLNTLNSEILTITSNSINDILVQTEQRFNITVDSNCTITEDLPDTFVTTTDNTNYFYTITGNTLNFIDSSDPSNTGSIIFYFIDQNTFFGGGSVFIRQ